jgi:hypothetical protein
VVDKLHPSWKQSFWEKFQTVKEVASTNDILTSRPIISLKDLAGFLDRKISAMKLGEISREVATGTSKNRHSKEADYKKVTDRVQGNSKAFAAPPDKLVKDKVDEGSKNKSSNNKVNKAASKEESKRSPDKDRCPICCTPGHEAPNCPSFKAMTPRARYQEAKYHKLHFPCLKRHRFGDCSIPKDQQACQVNKNCKYYHHELLHDPEQKQGKQEGTYAVLPAETPGRSLAVSGEKGDGKSTTNNQKVLASPPHAKNSRIRGTTLRLIKLFMKPKGSRCKPTRITAFQDPGSSLSYVDEEEIRKFGLPLRFKREDTTTLHGTKKGPTADVELELSRDGQVWTLLRDTKTLRDFRLPGPELKWSQFVQENPEFQGVQVDDVKFEDVRLLIGGELEDALLPLEEPNSRVRKGGVAAYKTKLGWTIGGAMNDLFGEAKESIYACLPRVPRSIGSQEGQEADEKNLVNLAIQLKRFNDLEAIGIEKRNRLPRAQQEDQEQLDKTTKWSNGRIQSKMLWSNEFQNLPESELMARKRLSWLQAKLVKQEGVWEKYAATIQSDLDKGYVRKLSSQEAADLRAKPHWFIPHFIVLHPDKPDRPRRVLDCAARAGGLSLNSLLNKGPKNLADLWGITQRFRVHPYVVIADITEMFSQVEVDPEDQNKLAFLWADKVGQEPEVLVNTRHVFGAKCSPAVAINAVRFAVQRVYPDLLPNVIKEFYMDDWLHGNATEEKAVEVTKKVAEALEESSFKLTKFVSNSKTILEQFPVDKWAPKVREFLEKQGEEPGLPELKALGLKWDAEKDTFGFSTRMKPKAPRTLADCLSQLASVFDPISIIGPFVMKGKLLFQEIFQSGKSWKDELESSQVEAWMKWIEEIPRVAELAIPRWHQFQFHQPVALHVFCDASTLAYGAVAYFVTMEGHRSFVAGKGRVVNKRKPPTIPKAELQALLIGARLVDSTMEQLESYVTVVRIIAWVDSQVVFCWIRNREKEYKPFVANRLGEIADIFEKYAEQQPEVRWVPTDKNPADLVSRSCSGEEMASRFEFWAKGPEFLSKSEDQWPLPLEIQVKWEEELIKKAVAAAMPPENQYQEFADLKAYLQKQLGKEEIELEEYCKGEEDLVRTIQKESFRTEMRQLKEAAEDRGKRISSVSVYFRQGPLQNREVFQDKNGILRVVTRLSHATWLSWGEKHPIALASKHPAIGLLIREYHQRIHHAGSRITYAEMSRKYQLPYSVVKREIFRCPECRKESPVKMGAPVAPLHRNRLQQKKWVWHCTGMDFFGPFRMRNGKAWGLLFTCLTTRAVHLEICPNLTIGSWLNALDRFIARRGQPAKIVSDNATTFVGGSRAFKKLVDQQLNEQFRKSLTEEVKRKYRIEFEFIPPGMPHYGGLWESMVKQVQRTLVKATKTVANLTYDALATFLTRAESIVNKRPLAIGEGLEIITPAQILAPASEAGHGFTANASFARVLGQLRQMIDHFWLVWSNQYVQLMSPHRLQPSQPGYVELKEGDQVIFQRKEGFHRLPGEHTVEAGIIKEALKAQDGIARHYLIQGKDGTIVNIPVKRVYLADQDLVDRRGPATGLAPE